MIPEILESGALRRVRRIAGSGLALTVFAVFGGACSTLDSLARMTPLPEDKTWRKIDVGLDAPFAVFADGASGLEVRVGVPLSGMRRVSYGPCLLPVLPGARERPRPLQLFAILQHTEGAAGGPLQVRLEPREWTVETRSEEFGVTFGADETRERLQPIVIVLKEYDQPWVWTDASLLSAGRTVAGSDAGVVMAAIPPEGALLADLTFGAYDNQFLDFRLAPLELRVNGRAIRTPPLQFERESDLDYTPFTTKILDL